MPPVLYCVCSCPAGDIVDGYVWDDKVCEEERGEMSEEKEAREKERREEKRRIQLDKEDRGRCARALLELGNREKRDILGFLTVDEVQGCETPDECWKGRLGMLRKIDGSRDYLDPLGAMDNRWGSYGRWVCKICAEEGRRTHDEERDKFWQALPRIFGLRDWNILGDLHRDALNSGN
jgi:hypothetical protein